MGRKQPRMIPSIKENCVLSGQGPQSQTARIQTKAHQCLFTQSHVYDLMVLELRFTVWNCDKNHIEFIGFAIDHLQELKSQAGQVREVDQHVKALVTQA